MFTKQTVPHHDILLQGQDIARVAQSLDRNTQAIAYLTKLVASNDSVTEETNERVALLVSKLPGGADELERIKRKRPWVQAPEQFPRTSRTKYCESVQRTHIPKLRLTTVQDRRRLQQLRRLMLLIKASILQ
jgi:hypothetical protein